MSDERRMFGGGVGADSWLVGHVCEQLSTLPDASIHACVTSPPYWGLRDYGVDPQEWPEVTFAPMPGLQSLTVPPQTVALGLELDPWAFVGHLVHVFRGVRRVLRPEGTLWLNLGDCYATGAGKVGEAPGGGEQGARWRGDVGRHRDGRRRPAGKGFVQRSGSVGEGVGPMTQPNRLPIDGLKPKDLVGVPWRVAFALQADGWFLRSDVVWSKPNPMPESVGDRPTKSHEYVFLLAKSERYFYDIDAIREPHTMRPQRRKVPPGRIERAPGRAPDNGLAGFVREDPGVDGHVGGRNVRSVWDIATRPFTEAHFATMPTELAERCVLAATSARGACAACGAPFERVTSDPEPTGEEGSGNAERRVHADGDRGRTDTAIGSSVPWVPTIARTIGWDPTCDCDDAGEPVPCVVLDSFGGAGTTALVSRRLGRRFRHVELNPAYLGIAQRRLDGESYQPDLFSTLGRPA